MGALQNFERRLEQAISGAFAKAFRSAVQPVDSLRVEVAPDGRTRPPADAKSCFHCAHSLPLPGHYNPSPSAPQRARHFASTAVTCCRACSEFRPHRPISGGSAACSGGHQ